jgi:hypothetical protein
MRAWLVAALLLLGCLVPVTVLGLRSQSGVAGAGALSTRPAPVARSSASTATSAVPGPSTSGPTRSARSTPTPPAISTTALAQLKAAIAERISAAPPKPQPAPVVVAHLDPLLQDAAAATTAATITVDITGDQGAVRAAVTSVGGRVTAASSAAIEADVPRTALAALAGRPGVDRVSKPVTAYPASFTCPPGGCSQGVAASQANVWQGSGDTGTGVTIGIVDAGFGGLATQQTAGNLPTGVTLVYPAGHNRCADDQATSHGTAVAEIVHQMAPGATLDLECVDSTVDFQAAEQELQAAGVKLVTSSLGFPDDSRGDGTGDPTSAAACCGSSRPATTAKTTGRGRSSTPTMTISSTSRPAARPTSSMSSPWGRARSPCSGTSGRPRRST